jgi:hypothetical protein
MKTKSNMTDNREIKIWKAKDQVCVVLMKDGDSVYQIDLSDDQMRSLIFILPQLFDDHKIRVVDKPLSVDLIKNDKI